MKLVINFDFFEAVLNAREDIHVFKVVRNNKWMWAKYYLLPFSIINFCLYSPLVALIKLGLDFSLVASIETILRKKTGIDTYKMKAEIDLRQLVERLSDMHIDTSYEMLLKTEMLEKEYHLDLNKDNLHILMENKYLLVPSYNAYSEEKMTSILQEHEVGSKQYVLSFGSPKKKTRLAYNHA